MGLSGWKKHRLEWRDSMMRQKGETDSSALIINWFFFRHSVTRPRLHARFLVSWRRSTDRIPISHRRRKMAIMPLNNLTTKIQIRILILDRRRRSDRSRYSPFFNPFLIIPLIINIPPIFVPGWSHPIKSSLNESHHYFVSLTTNVQSTSLPHFYSKLHRKAQTATRI